MMRATKIVNRQILDARGTEKQGAKMLQEFKRPVWQHQREALERFSRYGRLLLLHPIGSGKSTTYSLFLRDTELKLGRCPAAIFLTRLSVVPHLQREIVANCYDSITRHVCVLTGSEDERIAQMRDVKNKVFITNYEATRMKRLWAVVKSRTWDLVTADESQAIKTPTTITSKYVRDLFSRADRRVLGTGTAVLNSPMDLWAQLQCLGTGAVDDNFWAWVKKNFYDANAGKTWLKWKDWQVIPNRLPAIRAALAINSHSVEREACLDLPPLVRIAVDVSLPPDLRRVYDELEEDFIATLDDGGFVATDLAITKLVRLQELCNGVAKTEDGVKFYKTAKLQALEELLDGLGDQKAVIWCNFVTPLAAIESLLKGMGLSYVRFTGEESQKEKQENLEAFKTKPSCRVMLATQAAGGVGVDGMQVASVAIYYSKGFNLEHDIQSVGRLHRAGQARSVAVYDIVTTDTVEERISDALINKLSMAELLTSFKREEREAA